MKILAFGEILWDIYPDSRHIGGAVMNFSVHAARLGADICFASAVGNDKEGSDALHILEDFGLSNHCIAVHDKYETGKCLITLDECGIPSYKLLTNTAFDHIPLPEGDFDVFCFGTLTQRSEDNIHTITKLLTRPYSEIFVDINIRPPFNSEKAVNLCLENATILKASDEDLKYISSEQDLQKAAFEIMQKHSNLKLIIVTLGENGAFVFDGNHYIHTSAVKTAVSSTVGAGDSFSAAFLVKYLNGTDISSCLDTAARLSSFVVSRQEAVPDYNGRDFI